MQNEDLAIAIDEAIIEGQLKRALELLGQSVDDEADREEIILLKSRLEELEQHLIVWHSKYESLFLPDESISLVYVGFEEGVKFPTGLEHDLNKYIASHS